MNYEVKLLYRVLLLKDGRIDEAHQYGNIYVFMYSYPVTFYDDGHPIEDRLVGEAILEPNKG